MNSHYETHPNLMRVAQELTKCRHPEKAAEVLLALLAAKPELMSQGGKED